MKRIFWNRGNERVALIIFMTMCYLFDRECDKKGVRKRVFI